MNAADIKAILPGTTQDDASANVRKQATAIAVAVYRRH